MFLAFYHIRNRFFVNETHRFFLQILLNLINKSSCIFVIWSDIFLSFLKILKVKIQYTLLPLTLFYLVVYFFYLLKLWKYKLFSEYIELFEVVFINDLKSRFIPFLLNVFICFTLLKFLFQFISRWIHLQTFA